MTLPAFVRRRLLQAVVTLVVMVVVIHAGVTVIPGDPVRALFGFNPPPPEVLAELRARYRLDEGYPMQLLGYFADLLTGNLGFTISFNPVPVSRLIRQALPISVLVAGAAVVIQIGLGYVMAVIGTMRRRGPVSGLVVSAAVLASAIPVIVTAYLFQVTFTVGYGGLGLFPFRYDGTIGYLVLAVTALALMLSGPVILLLRSEMIAALDSGATRWAIASGLSTRRVVGVHVARATIGPVIAYVAANLGYLITGLVVVESVFGIPGIGSLIINGIQARDRSLVVGAVVVVSLLVIVANLVADIVSAALDPRLRTDERQRV